MVVFTCGHCGESVQKPKVEKHYLTKCRNRNPNLSCMDCFKDFLGNAYESHTKCITEEERYSGKGFMAKEKKGERKQNTWVEMVQSVLDEQKNIPGNVQRIIETVSKHNNTPRKKPKFFNFVKNVCGPKTSPKDIDQAWDLISVKLTALSNANANNRNQNQNNTSAEVNGKSEEKSEGDEVVNGDSEEMDKVNGTAEDTNEDDETQNQANGEGEGEHKNKKMSKKQRKEEKKRKKYEAELQSAVEAPEEEEEEVEETQQSKKGKKKKTKSESSNGDIQEAQQDGKNKNKKRKRQDTVNSVPEVQEKDNENIENEPIITKTSKKKLKMKEDEDLEESICLHDQNVAKIEELTMSSDKFNWHAVIMSVLQKKGNELPFKRLQKKVLMEYSEATGREVDDRIAEKFIKKLKSAPNVRVDKNRVMLLD
uniref:Uncharacterized protein n=1 Tax=Pectinophora gossypiella TaxID=13191 RepID=A0A1E1WN33_PECGO